MPSDSTFFNLAFQTKSSDFENFLALVPPDYEDDLKDIKQVERQQFREQLKDCISKRFIRLLY